MYVNTYVWYGMVPYDTILHSILCYAANNFVTIVFVMVLLVNVM